MEKFRELTESRDVKVGDIYSNSRGKEVEVIGIGDERGVKIREKTGKINFIRSPMTLINRWELISYVNEADYATTDKAFAAFTNALAKLSKKTGITIETTGGLYYDDPKTIKSVTYSKDFSSGDLSCDLVEK